ncbi:MAG TPA: dihydrodipicolinate synthase family protein, partial [Elusimicrobiota bacterium]|nr:dihydrodipicolinate synthase family protein [Elusimicrobiota bacterium]
MFEGSCVALVTPFKDGLVDDKKLAELVEFQIAGGTSAIVP